MYINPFIPFLMGVVCTITVELVGLFVAAFIIYYRDKRK